MARLLQQATRYVAHAPSKSRERVGTIYCATGARRVSAIGKGGVAPAALGWAEAVTDIQNAALREPAKAAVREHFNDEEIANLTLAIAAIGVWNRMEIGSGAFA